MTCDFTSFPTVYQSYQDNGKMIMKGCVQWNHVYSWEDFTSNWGSLSCFSWCGPKFYHLRERLKIIYTIIDLQFSMEVLCAGLIAKFFDSYLESQTVSMSEYQEQYVFDITVQILCIGTDRSQQTVQTKIRLLLKKQSDQGLRCLPFHQHLLDALMHCFIKLFYS